MNKEDVRRATELIRNGRVNLENQRLIKQAQDGQIEENRQSELRLEAQRKANEMKARQDMVRKTGVLDILEGLGENGVIEGKTSVEWRGDDWGFEFKFNSRGADYDFVGVTLTNSGLMINGSLVKEGELVEKVAEAIVRPWHYSYEPPEKYDVSL